MRRRFLAVWMNETKTLPGTDWRGRVVTTTNVASVEVRTESFSFNAQRSRLGEFAFDQHVLDIVPQYKRAYVLQIIARRRSRRTTGSDLPLARASWRRGRTCRSGAGREASPP